MTSYELRMDGDKFVISNSSLVTNFYLLFLNNMLKWAIPVNCADQQRNRPMKRTSPPSILCLVTLGLLGVTAFAADAPSGRQVYSSRQPGAPRRTQPIYDDQPVYLDQPVIFESSEPRMAPLPPGARPTPPVSAPTPYSDIPDKIIFDGPVFVEPEARPEPDRRLSGIDFPMMAPPKKGEEAPKPILNFETPRPVDLAPAVSIDKNDQIDEFYARLAKLQLEKKQLDETLTLIGKIKSDAFKVKTLVDLAEYVAHDINYKMEADQLFIFAQNGIDALADGSPVKIVFTTPENKIPPIPEPVGEKAPPKKDTILDIPDDPKPDPSPKKPPLLDVLDDEPVAEVRPPSTPPGPRLLDNLDDDPAIETKKPFGEPVRDAGKKSTAPSRKPPLLDDLDDEPAATTTPTETQGKKPPGEPVRDAGKKSTVPSKKPSLLEPDDDPIITPPAKDSKESEPPTKEPIRTTI